MVKPFVLNKENDMSEVKETLDNEECSVLMDALWIAITWFENKEKLDDAKKCRELWNKMYEIKYGKEGA